MRVCNLAPEALLGEGYSEVSDLFAVGVVLYECLVGHQPLRGTGRELSREILLGDYVPLDAERAACWHASLKTGRPRRRRRRRTRSPGAPTLR